MRELSIAGTRFLARRALADRQVLLHCDPDDAPELAKATGLHLPEVMLTSTQTGTWSALHLSASPSQGSNRSGLAKPVLCCL